MNCSLKRSAVLVTRLSCSYEETPKDCGPNEVDRSGGDVGVMEPPSAPLPFHVCWRGPQPGMCVRASMESGQGPSLVTPCVFFPGTFPDDDHLIGVCPRSSFLAAVPAAPGHWEALIGLSG